MSYGHPGPASLPNDCALLAYVHPTSSEIDSDSEDNSSISSDEREHDHDDDDDHPHDYSSRTRPSVTSSPNAHSSLRPHQYAYGSYGSTSRRSNNGPATAAHPNKRRPSKSSVKVAPRRDFRQGGIQPNGEYISPGQVASVEQECVGGGEDQTNTWAGWWAEAKVLGSYTLPVAATHVLEYSLVITSVISLGHLGTTDLAASTLGTMTANVTGLAFIQGLVSALDSVLPQAWTSGDPTLVGLWSQRMTFITALSLIPILIIWQTAEDILLLLRQEPAIAHLAGVYLRWFSLGLPAYAFNSISRRYFQCQGLLHIPSIIITVIAPINIVLNYLLVWGPPPFNLGYIGAPIATAISFNLISIASIIIAVFFTPHTAWRPLSWKSFKEPGSGKGMAWLAWIGIAGVGQTASEWWSWELVGLAASFLGAVSLASQSVLLVSASFSYQGPYALSVASSVRIGNLLGAGQSVKAEVACKISVLLAFAIASFSSTVFLTFRHVWGRLFNDDPEVIALVARIMPLVALFQVFDAVSAVTAGILRARGKQALGALLNLTAYYIVGIPFGLFLTFKFAAGLMGLWIGLSVALLYTAVVSVWMVLRTDWDEEIWRAMERLGGGHGHGHGHGGANGTVNGIVAGEDGVEGVVQPVHVPKRKRTLTHDSAV